MPGSNRQKEDHRAALAAYFDSLKRDFDDGIQRAREYYAVEGIHDLRVATKKLRAFFRLVSKLHPDFDTGAAIRPLKKVYGVAGQLRDIDIQQEILLRGIEKFQVSEFINELKQMEFALRPALMTAIRELPSSALTETGRFIGRALRAASDEDLSARLDLSVRQSSLKLQELLAGRTPSIEELHDIRKAAKACKYTLDAWQQAKGESKASTIVSARLKEAYTHLGNWHDARVTQDAISTFLSRETPRNLFAPSAYQAFLRQLGSSEKNHLKVYKGVVTSLRAALASWQKGHTKAISKGPGLGAQL